MILKILLILCQVHYKFELMDETLFLTVNIIDRFLEKQVVPRKKLQLVGVTAMLLACKYEEVSVPVVEDLVLISDRAYTKGQILEMVTPLNQICTFTGLILSSFCIPKCKFDHTFYVHLYLNQPHICLLQKCNFNLFRSTLDDEFRQ